MTYDPYQFAGRYAKPVRATRMGDGAWDTTGVDFSDYSRMSTQTRKQAGERRLETPMWALNDQKLQELLVVFMEERARLRIGTGSLFQRLSRARREVMRHHVRMNVTLDNLCKHYVTIKHSKPVIDQTDSEVVASIETLPLTALERLYCADIEWARRTLRKAFDDDKKNRLRQLEIEIEGIDTYLRYTHNGGADVLAAIVYLYYRVGMDSVGVGAQLHLKPPHVRQLLWRLNETWKERFGEEVRATPPKAPAPLWDWLAVSA
jgi:hypothetical protein